jgi:hypothetical protein
MHVKISATDTKLKSAGINDNYIAILLSGRDFDVIRVHYNDDKVELYVLPDEFKSVILPKEYCIFF